MSFCRVERDGHLLVVTLDRPEVRNALHRAASDELDQVWAAFEGGMHRLARSIPLKTAMAMLLTGRRIGADEAHRIGLVSEVVPLAELLPAARRWAHEILDCAPLSVQATKEAVLAGLSLSL